MSFGSRASIAVSLSMASIFLLVSDVLAAPVVWTGPTITFSKVGGTDPTLPANQDHLTDNVILTRGSSEGIYNIAKESSYDKFSGAQAPADTRWATIVNNPGATITATNFAALNFTSWAAAYGGPGFALSSNITTDNAVVHLVTDDIYLDLNFTQFSSGGSFAYQRSTPSLMLTPTGDYNGNGIVDAADYTIWRDTLGSTTNLAADGNGNGIIDAGDNDVWKSNFGNHSGLGASANAAVPEPLTLLLLLVGIPTICASRWQSCRKLMRP
jgi:hypothetical protein